VQPRVNAHEVSDTYARYSFGIDNRRNEVIESCFAEGSQLQPFGETATVGREAIAERLMRVADPAVVHHAFNIVILRATSEQVFARADFTMAKRGAVFATGHYDDCLVRDAADGWVFSRRLVTYTWRDATATAETRETTTTTRRGLQ
jgi:hypothetical protein